MAKRKSRSSRTYVLKRANKDPIFADKKLWEGKHIILDLEGFGKSHALISAALKFADEVGYGKLFTYKTNTNKKREECLAEALMIKRNLGTNIQVIDLPSSREICLNLLKQKLNKFYEMTSKQMGIARLYIISLHNQSYKILKEVSTYKGETGYRYRPGDYLNVMRSINQFMKRVRPESGLIKHDLAIIVQYDNEDYDEDKLENFLDSCISESPKGKRLSETISEKLENLDFLKGDSEFTIIPRTEINSCINKLKKNEDLLYDIKNNFGPESESMFVLIQNEKFKYEFDPIRIPKDRQEYLYNNMIIIEDEIPISLFTATSLSEICETLGKALSKPENQLTCDEYSVLKCVDPTLRDKIQKRTRSGKTINDIIDMDCKIKVHITNENTHLNANAIGKNIKDNYNPTITNFKNIVMSTTELVPCELLKFSGFKVHQIKRSKEELKIIEPKLEDVTVNVFMRPDHDTTKKNDATMRKFIKEEKKKKKNTFFVGKASYGCHATIDSLKGSNEIFKDPNIKEMDIFLSPINPNRVFNVVAGFYENIPEENRPKNLFELIVYKSIIDDINQALGRSQGIRRVYRRSLGLEDIKVNIYISRMDQITMDAIRNCRYINKNTKFNYIFE